MIWKQEITPNFDPVIYQGEPLRNWLGWCMAYVEQSVGQMYVYDNAMEGWDKVKGRHSDKNVPKGVWTALWYRGWVYNGVEQGHVLWAKFNKDGTGVAYTSPNDPKPNADKIKFSSLDDLTRQLQQGWASDISYRGWSEYVGEQRIIKYEEDEMVTIDELNVLYRLYIGKPTSDYGKRNYLGKKKFVDVQRALMKSPTYKAKQADAKAGKLNPAEHLPFSLQQHYKEPAKAVVTQIKLTTLEPGVYEVK